jgi:nucleoside-diphosphate-sugar epimerase
MRWSYEPLELAGTGRLCVLDDQGWVNPIYVDDLVRCVQHALETEVTGGTPFFVSDDHPRRWSDFLDPHAALVGAAVPRVRRQDVTQDTRGIGAWLRASVRPLAPVLRSREFRAFVLDSPLMRATAFRAYLVLRTHPSARRRLEKLLASGDAPTRASAARYDANWVQMQMSEARLSVSRLETVLGFKADVSFEEGFRRSCLWFRAFGLLRGERPKEDVRVEAARLRS